MPSLDLNGETTRASQRCAARRVHGTAAARDAEVQARQAARRLLARQRLQGDRLRADHGGRSGGVDGGAPGRPRASRTPATRVCRRSQKKSRWRQHDRRSSARSRRRTRISTWSCSGTKLGEVEAQVCRIEIDTPRGTVYGTGFLLGPDVLMTNHHVMESVDRPARCRRRLPYSASTTSGCPTSVIAEGSTFKLAPDWLIDYSPPSAVDLEAPSRSRARRKPDELDYALVRLAGAPGNAPVGQKPDPECSERGWITVGAGQGVPAAGSRRC